MSKRKTPGLNTQSTADIAFLLLCYFLMVSTMDQQSGLQRRLPPMPDKNQKVEDQKVNRRNIIIVKEFLTNPTDDPALPEKEIKNIEGFGSYPVSKGVISLQNDRGTSYRAYIAVQNELVKAINELRDQFSIQNYGKTYLKLDEEKQKIVKEAIPQNISEAEPKDVAKK